MATIITTITAGTITTTITACTITTTTAIITVAANTTMGIIPTTKHCEKSPWLVIRLKPVRPSIYKYSKFPVLRTHFEEEDVNVSTAANDFLNSTTSAEADHDKPDIMGNSSIVVNNSCYDELPSISSQPLPSEILVYCQNFNRMRNALKISEIH